MKRIAYLSIALVFAACTSETAESDVAESTETVEATEDEPSSAPTFPKDRKFDDLANFLAGMQGDPESVLKSLEEGEGWKSYSVSMQGIWKTTNEKLPIMKKWSSEEMGKANEGGGTLFYPFSGPDFLHADVFFPEHENIVMLALEPIGTFPDMVQKEKDGKDQAYLNGIRNSLNMILAKSFFRTIAMASDFKGEVDGNLPVLMQFMKRTGHNVLYQEQVAVLPDGKLTTDLENISDTTYIGNRYYFQREGSDKVRTLTYFAVNIQNGPYEGRSGLESRTDFIKFLKSSDIKSTYIKSASYLMHRPTFSVVRDLILSESEYLLQDDSGIPIKFFDKGKWELTFYGNYEFPISLFAERHQKDLKSVYDGEGVKDLPFGIGYQYQKGTSNLMRAVKK